MSNLERDEIVRECGTEAAAAATTAQQLAGRKVTLGETSTVLRLLPSRARSTVGPWCFADHFGPDDVSNNPGMRVPPHPHTGLQTVTWLVRGEVLHRDSLGTEQLIRPGQLNLMTAGRGVAHSEESPIWRSPTLHGVQLWIALPRASADVEPAFEHLPSLPRAGCGAFDVTVLLGSFAGATSPAATYSPIVGVEAVARAGAAEDLPLRPDFEYAALLVTGLATVAGVPLAPGTLLYLGRGRTDLPVHVTAATRLLLLGGEPLRDPFIMWWNFIAYSNAGINAALADWEQGRRFGTVRGFDGDPLPAPPLPPGRLRPRL